MKHVSAEMVGLLTSRSVARQAISERVVTRSDDPLLEGKISVSLTRSAYMRQETYEWLGQPRSSSVRRIVEHIAL